MKEWPGWIKLSLGVIIGLAASALILLVARQPQGQPITLSPRSTPSLAFVHVTGAVAQPGVYELDPGARIIDAINIAGGAVPEANLDALNLANLITDGQKIIVPLKGQSMSMSDEVTATNQNLTNKLDLNSATLTELIALPGIGEDRANEIIRYREKNNGFTRLDELLEIEGIGQSTYERLKDLVIITPIP